MLVFSDDARVDATKTVAYSPPRQRTVGSVGDRYCAAPIVGGGPIVTPVTFWAVGKNCCDEQNNIFLCMGSSSLHGGQPVSIEDVEASKSATLAIGLYSRTDEQSSGLDR